MTTTLSRLLHRFRQLSPAAAVPDAALLAQFVSRRDEDAFAALVARHGAMVLNVCQRVLGNPYDAEDAFQATFLVLANRADAIARPAALAGWLYGVASRVARRARQGASADHRQQVADVGECVDPRPGPADQLSARELLRVLEEEVQALPERYRLPVALCCLEGLSQEEAAARLGWGSGSLRGRLERGRRRLHERLTRRGVTLGAALGAAEVSRGMVAARGAEALVRSAGLALAGRCSAEVVGLAEGVGQMLVRGKLQVLAAVVLAASVVGASGVLGGWPPGSREPSEGTARAREGFGQLAVRAGPPQPAPRDLLSKVIHASLTAGVERSGSGEGTFTYYVQEVGEDALKLRQKAKVQTHFDQGKYRLRFDYQTKLEMTTYVDLEGKESKPKLAEWKALGSAFLNDGERFYEVGFDKGNPGCTVEEYGPKHAAQIAGLSWEMVAGLGWRSFRVDQFIRNTGRGAIKLVPLPGGGLRGTCAPEGRLYRVEFDALPEAGYHVVAWRSYNGTDTKPISAGEITWEKRGKWWYARKMVSVWDGHQARTPFAYTKAVFEFDTFEPEAKVDPKLFTLTSLGVPGNARWFDRRPGK